MKLTATRRLKRYGGKDIKAGEVFECKPSDVRILKALDRATDYVEPPKRLAAIFKPPVMTRAVVAEDAPHAPVLAPEPAVDQQEPHQKRAYKRRDMVSE